MEVLHFSVYYIIPSLTILFNHLVKGDEFCLPPNVTSLVLQPYFSNYTIDQTVSLSCDHKNLTLIGPTQITCSENGQWDSKLPICTDIGCPMPEPPRYGLAELEYFNETDIRVIFSCLYKYTLVGVSQIYCDENTDTWSHPTPACYASCEEPPIVAHGKWQLICMHENCTVTYRCDAGYSVQGPGFLTCLPTGVWSELTTHCQEITCQAPALTDFGSVATDLGPNYENRYQIGTNATYRCYTNKYTMIGNDTITCLASGSWSSLPPICQIGKPTTKPATTIPPTTTELPTTIATTETTVPTPVTTFITVTTSNQHNDSIPCREPGALQNGSYRRYSRFIIYHCRLGYMLLGNDERHCYDNGSWSGKPPRCVAINTTTVTNKPFHWKQVFIDHGKWQGQYQYLGHTVTFTFTVQSVQLDPPPAVLGIFKEGNIKFELKGSEEQSGEIVFHMIRLFVSSERFPTINWSTRGWLQEHPCRWTYTGTIQTPLEGFQSFHMETERQDRINSEECRESDSKMTEYIVVGIFVSILVICVPLVAFLWIRRDRFIQGGGHRTLTSFENPVYDYENSLK